jgi:hypothetical protein
LDEEDDPVHELKQLGGDRRRLKSPDLIAFVELAQAGDSGQRPEPRDQAVCGLAHVLADGLGECVFEGVIAGAGAAPKLGFVVDDVRSYGTAFPEAPVRLGPVGFNFRHSRCHPVAQRFER